MEDTPGTPSEHDLSKVLRRNVDAVAELHERDKRRMSPPQRAVEKLAKKAERPVATVAICIAVGAWVAVNALGPRFGLTPFDRFPFHLLGGILAFVALLLTVAVLARQSRQDRQSARHASLDLQVNMLVEQRTAKLVELVEELRRDLPNVHDRVDRHAEALSEPADPRSVLQAVDDRSGKPAERKKE